jgi:hypothetical protein
MDILVRRCNYDRMNLERIFARGFVLLGGAIWVAAALGAASKTYLNATPMETAWLAFIPLALAITAFLVGWFYERLAAVLLFAGAAVVVVWGLIGAWEMGVWMTMTAMLIAPTAVAGLLYLMAAMTQTACELQEKQADVGR